jgi:hypothetical protein
LWGTGIPAEFDGLGFRMERVWVEGYAPIYSFLSRSHWIQLDAAWKGDPGNYTRMAEYVAVNASEFNATANATIDNVTGYVAGTTGERRRYTR